MTHQVNIRRDSNLDEVVRWLVNNIGEGQSVHEFTKKPTSWAFPGSTFNYTPILIADANKAMLFKLIWV